MSKPKQERAHSALAIATILLGWLAAPTIASHISGTFDTGDFFKFLAKFAFEKAEIPGHSFGYIYGNVTAVGDSPVDPPVTLVVLDKPHFIEFYKNRNFYVRETACARMFARLQKKVYDPVCNPRGTKDYFRKVPCKAGALCVDEDTPANVVPGGQFTYVISEAAQPRFWFVALVACYRNVSTCTWHSYPPQKTASLSETANNNNHNNVSSSLPLIHYDIHLSNRHPNFSAAHPLTAEFSFDQQNLLEMYLIFLLVYVVLVPMQIYAVRLQKHPVTRLFTISLLSEFVSLGLITWHLIDYAMDGVGQPDMQAAGDILDIFSRTTFMLILLLLAKGWAVTRQQINRTGWIGLMTIWVPYCAFHVFLYIWDRTEVDIVSDIDEYQTWPGWIVLILRTSFMMWFLYELRNTMKYEHSTKKLDFLLHLGASSLVWFIYLPIVALVALQVSPMWRYKLLLGITNSADCLAYCVMTGLLWPNRSGQYLLLAGTKYAGMDELDEFNEAPHIVRERELRRNSPEVLVTNGGTSHPHNHLQLQPNSVADACSTELLEAEDLDAELLTDLNKHSHVVA